jgi:hypothetical protein
VVESVPVRKSRGQLEFVRTRGRSENRYAVALSSVTCIPRMLTSTSNISTVRLCQLTFTSPSPVLGPETTSRMELAGTVTARRLPSTTSIASVARSSLNRLPVNKGIDRSTLAQQLELTLVEGNASKPHN